MEAFVASYRSSGLTQRAFCEREGIKLPNFSYRIEVVPPCGSCNEGIKLPNFSYWLGRVSQDNSASGSFVEVTSHPITAEGLEVVFPNGMIVRGIRDLSVLERLLDR